jgi:hypothetical protein
LLPLTSQRYIHSFEGYSRAFKAYTEDKYYTQGNNLGSYIRSLVTLEDNFLRDIERLMSGSDVDYWAEVHNHFHGAWKLLAHHLQEIR